MVAYREQDGFAAALAEPAHAFTDDIGTLQAPPRLDQRAAEAEGAGAEAPCPVGGDNQVLLGQAPQQRGETTLGGGETAAQIRERERLVSGAERLRQSPPAGHRLRSPAPALLPIPLFPAPVPHPN